MERLTYWNEELGCWSYHCPSGDAAKRLAEYENMEERGLLLRLPCKVGDIVYYPDNEFWFIVVPVEIVEIILRGSNTVQYNGCIYNRDGDPEREFEFDSDDFGENVFRVKEEAEKALANMTD